MKTVLFAAVVAFVGCGGGGGGGGGGGDDDDVPSDGSNPQTDGNPTPDGPAETAGIGTSCTPDRANPQGTCPTGFECLNLTDATTPWCSKTCASGAGDQCAVGYTGAGKAACILGVTPAGGGTPVNYCSVICEDSTGNNGICPAGQCNGTCPGSLLCTGDITNNNPPPAVIGKACE
ncbi:MAG: hypothetical protein H0V17_01185 [Deltaproteobacteria bacterium]|nr:hypothetical protein [Deltaproteobacteria bacterium]